MHAPSTRLKAKDNDPPNKNAKQNGWGHSTTRPIYTEHLGSSGGEAEAEGEVEEEARERSSLATGNEGDGEEGLYT